MNDPLGSFFIILKFLCKVFTYSNLIKIEKESANKIETSDSIFCSFPREKNSKL